LEAILSSANAVERNLGKQLAVEVSFQRNRTQKCFPRNASNWNMPLFREIYEIDKKTNRVYSVVAIEKPTGKQSITSHGYRKKRCYNSRQPKRGTTPSVRKP